MCAEAPKNSAQDHDKRQQPKELCFILIERRKRSYLTGCHNPTMGCRLNLLTSIYAHLIARWLIEQVPCQSKFAVR